MQTAQHIHIPGFSLIRMVRRLSLPGRSRMVLSTPECRRGISKKRWSITLPAGLAIVFLLTFSVSAQKSQYLFSNIDKSHGLSHNHVISFLKDTKGFIWIGTIEGLCRFDGYSFRVFINNPADTGSLKDNIISDLFEDNQQRIWITAGDYFMIYDPETETFTSRQSLFRGRVPIPHGSKWFHRYDPNRDIIFANTVSGVFKYIVSLDSVIPVPFTGIDPERLITWLDVDRTGNIWLACKNARLYEISGISMEIVDSLDLPVNIDNSYRFFVDRENDLWIYDLNNAAGLIVYRTDSGKLHHLSTGSAYGKLSNNTVSCIHQDEDGNMWAGTDHGGINVINPADLSVNVITNKPTDKMSLCDNSITNLYRDDQGFMWIGSFKHGLSYYHKNLFLFDLFNVRINNSKTDGYNDIDNFAEDRYGNIWIGTNGGGLIYFDRKKNTYTQYLHDPADPSSISANVIIGMLYDSKGRLWIGTYMGGLNLWDGKKFHHFRNNPEDTASLSDDRIWDICEDSKGMLWIATLLGGINVFDPEKKKVIACYRSLERTTIRSNVVFSVMSGRNHTMWFATVDGIRSFDQTTGKFTYYSHDENDPRSLSKNFVLDVFEDSRGFIWAATSDGLNRLDLTTGKFDIFRQEDGLPGNLIIAITEDNNNDLWMSTSRGLSKLTVTQDPASDSLHFTFRNFDELDGLQGKEFNEKAIMKARSGELFFGGPKGFNIIDPDNIRAQDIQSNIVFTDFLIFNKSISNNKMFNGRILLKKSMPYTGEIRLKHDENVFTIEFSNLNYIHPEKRKYMYRMDNFKDEWFTADSRERRVTYTNLNPGRYLFRVRSTNNDGTWNMQEARLSIVIRPPWWQTLVIRLLGIILAASSAVGFYYYRLRSLNRQKTRLETKVMERSTELYVTNTKLREQQKEVLETNQELEKHRNNLEQMIRERTSELEKALRKARESDRLKSAFLANMSHEIRTPMNAIVGFSGLLDEKEISPEEQSECIQLIHSNSESLLMLINDILDLSLIEANQLVIRVKPFRLNELLDEIKSYHTVRNSNQFLTIGLKNPLKTDDIILLSDKLRVKQVLSNFMSNACKFTLQGSVELGVSRANKRLNLYVRDTGSGIDGKDMPHIFERFYRLSEEISPTTRGAGLGLAISKKLTELLGGTIDVVSEPGKGSVFTLSLPYSLVMNPIPVRTMPPKNTETMNWSGKKILVVEDEEANCLYLKRILAKTQAEITIAENGIEAVNKVKSGQHFDLVLMDIKMPLMDGSEALKLMKEQDPGLIIIAQTAFASNQDELQFIGQGFDDYIAKPIQYSDIIRILEKHF